MRFWDSSAIVPLVLRESQSSRRRAWLRDDPVLVAWALASMEGISGLARKRREGVPSEGRFADARRQLSSRPD